MIPRRAPRYGGQVRGQGGFTVTELLIALAIVMLITGALAQAVEPARAAFDRVPAELDQQQRGRTAIEILSQAVRSAGRNVAATHKIGAFSEILPVLSLADPDESGEGFASLTVIGPSVDGAQGILAVDQSTDAAPITLAATSCPGVKDVCGFTPGMTAIIADGEGHYAVFVVASTAPGTRALVSDRAFSRPFPIGSAVIGIDQFTFRLAGQADGSRSLVRETAAGAVQPMVDFVTAIFFNVSDQQVDVAVTVQASTGALRRVLADREFRTSIMLRNAS